MTQPASLTKTFDTSLIDVQQSFSSTETDTSGSSAKEDAQPTPHVQQREPSPYRTVPTGVLYSQWASTYDTDGNVLQAADDIQLRDLLPKVVRLTRRGTSSAKPGDGVLRVLDLGCGTGRNTVKLLQSEWGSAVDIVGWDGSQAMLEIARSKCEGILNDQKLNVGIELEQIDISDVENVPERYKSSFDGLISTLVLEHIEISAYFGVLAKLLRPGSYALVTNMHAHMGARSQAGYKTPSGERFKATSYVYSIPETVEAARMAGFEVIRPVREMQVDESMFDNGVLNGSAIPKGRVAESARKWIGTYIWYGMILRRI